MLVSVDSLSSLLPPLAALASLTLSTPIFSISDLAVQL